MRSKLIFVLFFIVFGFLLLQIPVNTLEGSRVKFTLFDLFAPVSAAFLGTPLGQTSILKLIATLRFLPMIFGVWMFAKKEGKLLVLPALSIIAFNLHPIGRTVWFYSLFWTIPFLMWPFRERSLVARSLASTFTAHAVGGAIWIWAFNLPANVWISLIPVVALERSIFALGISASYILTSNVLGILSARKLIPKSITFDKRYLLK